MVRPILRLATRVNRRTRFTAWAVAFACMVLVGSLSLVDGLSAGVDQVTSRFRSGPSVYVRGSDLLASAIDEDGLAGVLGNYTALRVHLAVLRLNGITRDVVLASLEEHRGPSVQVPFPAASNEVAVDIGLAGEIEAASGRPLEPIAGLTLFGTFLADLPVAPPPASRPALFPDAWAWVRPEFLLATSPTEGGPIQAVLTDAPIAADVVAQLGLSRLETVGMVGFARGGVAEARGALLALTALIAAVIGLLVYSTMGLEVRLREAEIRTLRSLGASPRIVAAVTEGQALLLGALGATLGSALGIVLAHAVVSFAPLVGLPNLVLLGPPLGPVLFAYAIAIVAAGVAGIVPSLRAVRALGRTQGALPS